MLEQVQGVPRVLIHLARQAPSAWPCHEWDFRAGSWHPGLTSSLCVWDTGPSTPIPIDPSSTTSGLYNTPRPFLFETFLINEQLPQHNSLSKTTLDVSAFWSFERFWCHDLFRSLCSDPCFLRHHESLTLTVDLGSAWVCLLLLCSGLGPSPAQGGFHSDSFWVSLGSWCWIHLIAWSGRLGYGDLVSAGWRVAGVLSVTLSVHLLWAYQLKFYIRWKGKCSLVWTGDSC